MYECKNCGRVLRYEIRFKNLKCDYCDSTFPVASYPDKSYKKKEYEANVFLCTQCGGEIVTQSNDMTGICAYCGTTQVFQCRTEMVQRPKYIIPFQNDKSVCKSQYERAIRKAFYAPKELKDPKFIDNIRGVYMPYWVYTGEYDQRVNYTGYDKKQTKHVGDKIQFKEYHVEADYKAEVYGMQKDASSWYSDEISDNLRPFRLHPSSGLQPFNPAYLCGFFGETADVKKTEDPVIEQYDEEAKTRSNRFVENKLEEKYHIIQGHRQIKEPGRRSTEMSLLPVWFLSYRKGDRVSYSVMNGQTGQFAAEFPIDIKKFLLCTLGAAVLLFLILNLFWIMRPEDVAMLAAVGAMWAVRFASADLVEITRKEVELAPPDRRKYVKRPERQIRPFKNSMLIPYVVIVGMIIAEVAGMAERYPGGILFIMPIIITIWALIGAYKERKKIKECRDYLKALYIKVLPLHTPAFISLWVALLVQILLPVYDYAYYAVAFGCMAMTFLSILGVVLSYNRMATRRMPQFDHMGGDDSAKTE